MWVDDWDAETEKGSVSEPINWGTRLDEGGKDVNDNPTGAYSKLSETLRQSFPHEATCSMFCGGKKCKYCCDEKWKEDEQAVKGLYSHWVTDNILATSRPITRLVEKYNVLEQFKEKGINAIINVQLPGEHAGCGDGVHDGEFSYKQQQFMDSGVFFYNFGWNDFGVVESMPSLLDMVKVTQFAVSEGKVAIHCHAGRGRTGVLIACFLVFNNRMTANQAVHYVRYRRPGSVQTSQQVQCVQDFERFLKPYRVVFSYHTELASFNLNQYLVRQRGLLHGFQGRKLKYLPKIIYVLCERLLKLAKKGELLHVPSEHSLSVELETAPNALQASRQKKGGGSTPDTIVDDPVLNPTLTKHQSHPHKTGIHGQGEMVAEVSQVAQALVVEELPSEVKEKVEAHEKKLNDDDTVWDELKLEDDSTVLATLMWNWLDHLKDPLVRSQDMELLLSNTEEPNIALNRMDKGVKTTITYLLGFIVRLQPLSEELECDILQKLICVLTHKSFDPVQATSVSCHDLKASTNSLTEMKGTERLGIFRFFYNLLEDLEDDYYQRQANEAKKSAK